MTTAAQMGYSESEFWDMTPRFFACAMKGYELRSRESWEIARIATYKMVSVNFNPKKKAPTLSDVWPMPWDKKAPLGVRLSDEELAERRARADARMAERQAQRKNKQAWQQ
jgi:hypothetical protein